MMQSSLLIRSFHHLTHVAPWLVAVGLTHAAVVGHWSFEEDAFLSDSSGNGLDLTTTGAAPSPATRPSTGNGSTFPGTANAGAAELSGSGNFRLDDSEAITVTNQFTVEFFFNLTATSSTASMIASQWHTASQRSWFVGVLNGQFRFGTSANGVAAAGNQSTALSLENRIQLDTDYYGAVSFLDGVATFYLMDLTNGGALISTQLSGFDTTVHDSTAAFQIGSYSSNEYRFTGLIDEVRFSNTALGPADLMIPEPAALFLSAASLPMILRRKRK